MTKFQYLQEQAARAERLARSILDAVTVETASGVRRRVPGKAEARECAGADGGLGTHRIRSLEPFSFGQRPPDN